MGEPDQADEGERSSDRSSPRPRRRLPSHLVARPRLLHRLDAGTPLTVLRAPLGFGKTTLVAQWLQARPRHRAVWTTVDSDSADADGFWPSLLDALDDAGIRPRRSDVSRPARAQVRRALAALPEELTLVVDAFERVTAEGIDRDLLDIVRASDNLRLVVCLRSHRSFPPYSYLDLDTTLLAPADLLLTVEETCALLEEVGLAASPERVAAIHADGGGWVEPTRAFAVAQCNVTSLTTGTPTDRDAATEVAATYLHDRILPAIDPARVAFALATSLVDGVTPELAALLTEGSAGAQLEQLETDGVLFATVEGGETVYRWPPAARRAMSAELARRSPELVRQLHARVGEWYLEHGQPRQALPHAVNAQDWALVVRLVDRAWRVLILMDREVVYAALDATPLEVLATSPRVLAVRDLRLQHPDDLALSRVPELPTDPDELRALGRGPDAGDVMDTGLAMTLMLRRRGLMPRAKRYADQLELVGAGARTARSDELAPTLPGLLLQIGLTRLLADDLPGAVTAMGRAYDDAPSAVLPYVRRDAAGKLALALAVAGETRQAQQWLARYRATPAEQGWLGRVLDSTALVAEALLALDRLAVPEAAAILQPLVGEAGIDEFWCYVAYAQGLVALYGDDASAGLRSLDYARAAHPDLWEPGSTARVLLATAEANLLLALGRGNQARAALHAGGVGHPFLRVPEARLLLLSGRPQEALDLATDAEWARSVERRQHVEMLLVQAVSHHRLGQASAAADALDRAVGSAQATGTLRAFVTVPGDDLRAVAARLPPPAASWLDTPALLDRPPLYPEPIDLVELTDRERLVLEKLAEGARVQDIATDLYVSVNTIKTHLRSIYGKLDATDRRQAVVNARRLGFLGDG